MRKLAKFRHCCFILAILLSPVGFAKSKSPKTEKCDRWCLEYQKRSREFIDAQTRKDQRSLSLVSELKSSIQEDLQKNFSVQNQILVRPMPPIKNAESAMINFCYAFSASGLVNQLLCRSAKTDCATDSVAMLDVALISSQGSIWDVGPSLDETLNATSGVQIATESCMPFHKNPFFQSSNADRIDLWQKVLSARYADQGSAPELRARNMSEILPFKVQTSVIVEALKEDDPHKFIGKLIENPICRSSGVTVPAFEVVSFHAMSDSAEDYETVKIRLKGYFSEGIPVGWSFCLKRSGYSCMEGHVVILHGSRELCSLDGNFQRKCEEQFLVRDSMNIIAGNPGDIWVNGKAFAEESAQSAELAQSNSDFPQFSVLHSKTK